MIHDSIKIRAKVEDLIGKTITRVEHNDYEILLHCKEGVYRFYHEQDCCEEVSIEDICGDIDDLCGKVYLVEERQSHENPEGVIRLHCEDSYTWTFYHFVTDKGYVDIRWYGESNGYYSESVDLVYYPAPGYEGKGHYVYTIDAVPKTDEPVLCYIKHFDNSLSPVYLVCRFHEGKWYYQAMRRIDVGALYLESEGVWCQVPDNWVVVSWRQIDKEE